MTADSEQSGPRAAAFFDLDKTLIEGSSGLDFVRAAYKAGMYSRRRLAADIWANLKFRLRGSTDEATAAIRERALTDLQGARRVDLARLTPAILATLLPRVYPEVLDAAFAHQDAGRPAYIVTAASAELAELVAHVLTLDGGIGARYEHVGGVYTGKPAGPFTYGEGKVEAIAELAEAEGIDLAASYAYSDSASDLPMLRLVGNPVAVNPDSELERIARAEGWAVMRFDKLRRRLRVGAGLAALLAAGAATGRIAERLGGRQRAGGRFGDLRFASRSPRRPPARRLRNRP